MLANLSSAESKRRQSADSQRINSNAELNYYFQIVGRKTPGLENKRSKPKNVTPAGKGRPYCRHKEFLNMPQYNLETVSNTQASLLESEINLFLCIAMHKDRLSVLRWHWPRSNSISWRIGQQKQQEQMGEQKRLRHCWRISRAE